MFKSADLEKNNKSHSAFLCL